MSDFANVGIRKGALPGVALLLATLGASAQGPERPPSPVRYTEAREHSVRSTVKLPGTVESRVYSTVATEVAGLVEELMVREGDVVKKEQPLARLRTTTRELQRQAHVAQLREAEARLKQAQRNLERASELNEEGIISRQEYDDRFYEVDAWQGRVEQLTAEIAQIDLSLRQSTIRAPFAGTITTERIEVGEWVDTGDPVVEIHALGELEVRVEVPEQYFRSLNPGARAVVTFEALPGYEVAGRITAIIPSADTEARTFPLKVRISNRQGRIGVGMLAQVPGHGGAQGCRDPTWTPGVCLSRGRQQHRKHGAGGNRPGCRRLGGC
jgi:RND family efflux transporter MFP subunit